MKWIVKIENKPELQIVVSFDPLKELVVFTGQYKPKNREWENFSVETHAMDIDLEKIKTLLFKTYDSLNKRLEIYKNISEGFEHIKLIEIKEDKVT